MSDNLPGIIDYAEAKEMHQNWLETRGSLIADSLGHEESYEVNFNAKELLNYLKYVIESSENQGLENPGIRILFGAYNEEENPSSNKLKTNATVVMVPTEESSVTSSCNKELNPLNRASTGWPPIGF